jgi:excisionase family DNA binding protein
MTQLRCPHCGRKFAEINLCGSLVFKTKCPRCNQMVELNLMNGGIRVVEQTSAPVKNVKPLVESVVLSPDEVAALMKVSRWTVYELVKRKRLPATKIGRGIRIPTKAVMEFINSGGADVLTGKGEVSI